MASAKEQLRQVSESMSSIAEVKEMLQQFLREKEPVSSPYQSTQHINTTILPFHPSTQLISATLPQPNTTFSSPQINNTPSPSFYNSTSPFIAHPNTISFSISPPPSAHVAASPAPSDTLTSPLVTLPRLHKEQSFGYFLDGLNKNTWARIHTYSETQIFRNIEDELPSKLIHLINQEGWAIHGLYKLGLFNYFGPDPTAHYTSPLTRPDPAPPNVKPSHHERQPLHFSLSCNIYRCKSSRSLFPPYATNHAWQHRQSSTPHETFFFPSDLHCKSMPPRPALPPLLSDHSGKSPSLLSATHPYFHWSFLSPLAATTNGSDPMSLRDTNYSSSSKDSVHGFDMEDNTRTVIAQVDHCKVAVIETGFIDSSNCLTSQEHSCSNSQKSNTKMVEEGVLSGTSCYMAVTSEIQKLYAVSSLTPRMSADCRAFSPIIVQSYHGKIENESLEVHVTLVWAPTSKNLSEFRCAIRIASFNTIGLVDFDAGPFPSVDVFHFKTRTISLHTNTSSGEICVTQQTPLILLAYNTGSVAMHLLTMTIVAVFTMEVLPLLGELAEEYGCKPMFLLIVSTSIVPFALLVLNQSKEFVYARIFCIVVDYAADFVNNSERDAAFSCITGLFFASQALVESIPRRDQKSSCLTKDINPLGRPKENGNMWTITTIQATHENILSLDYGDFSTELTTVDAQESSHRGVLVLVTGYLTGKNNENHVSDQTIILSEEANEEDVHNPFKNGDVKIEEETPVPEVVNKIPEHIHMDAESSSKMEEAPQKSYASLVIKNSVVPILSLPPASLRSIMKIQDQQPTFQPPQAKVFGSANANTIGISRHNNRGACHLIQLQ